LKEMFVKFYYTHVNANDLRSHLGLENEKTLAAYKEVEFLRAEIINKIEELEGS
jgi:hypothetical protein